MIYTKVPISRRTLLGTAGAAVAASAGSSVFYSQASAQDDPNNCAPIGAQGKSPVQFKANANLPIRVRKSAFELSRLEIDRLKAAYAALRQLSTDKPDDPLGWLRQGFVHCWYCGGGADGAAGEEIHGGWFFFPWHRAYLYFHERVLCKLLGDDTFALPYWDWDSEGRQKFPDVYGDPADRTNPLSDLLRSAMPGSSIPGNVVSPRIMNLTINAPTPDLFFGSQTLTQGAMERQPHGPVHIWTGDTTMQSQSNDMGVLVTAAQDPVFFVHHGNIDRLWTVWISLSPQHQVFNSPTWLGHPWQFYDENGIWTEISVADVLDPAALRIQYQPPTAKPIWKYTPRSVPVATLSKEAALVLASSSQGFGLETVPITQSIALPDRVVNRIATLKASSAPEFILHIEDIQVANNAQLLFNVFLNLPTAKSETSVELPNFIGTVSVLAKSKDASAHHHASTNAAFDITEGLGQVLKGAKSLSVTLVPVAANGSAPRTAHATIKRIYVDRL